MAAYELLLLNTAIPQIQAAQSGDTYVVPRDIAFSAALTLSAGTANGVPYLNASKVLTTGSALTFDGTNLGLSNSAVATVVKIDGSGRYKQFETYQSGTREFYFGYDSTNLIGLIYQDNNRPIAFGIAGSEQMRLTSTGLGIGTNNPGQKLDTQAAVTGTYNSTTQQIVARFFNSPADLGSGVNSAFITLQTTPDGGGSNPVARVGVVAESYGSNNGAFVVATRNASGVSEKMRLDSSGNLGLGVTPSTGDIYYRKFELGKVGCGLTAATTSLTSSELTYLTGNAYARYTGGNPWVYGNDGAAAIYGIEDGTHSWYNAPSGTANTTTITNNVSYTIITSGNQTAFGAANNNVGTVFTATSSGTLSSGTVSQNISFTQAMTLDASGDLVVGGTSANVGTWNKAITLNTASGNASYELTVAGAAKGFFAADASNVYLQSSGAIPLIFTTNGGERARITSGGYFKASNAGTYQDAGGTYHELRSSASDVNTVFVANTSASPYGQVIKFSSASPDNNTNWFFTCEDSTTTRLYIYSDGDLANHDGVYGTISDQKLKQDIVDAGSQWDDIKAIRFRKYRMKSDVAVNPDAPALLGVVAQELEQVSPGLVDEHPDMETVEVTDEDGNVTQTQQPTGTTTKTVKSSILLMKAAVALQEAMARIEKLEAEVAALKGA